MAGKKSVKNLQKGKAQPVKQTQQPPQKIQPSHKAGWVPIAILVVVFGIFALNWAGIIQLPHFGSGGVYEISPPATIGVPCAYNFSELIDLLPPESHADSQIYTFYLGSGVGFPPMGLILGIDGILRGTPTGKGSKFQVCVKDAGGRSFCRTYHLEVNSKDDNDNNVNPGKCPTTPCDMAGNCCGNSEPDPVTGSRTVTGILVPGNCSCPVGTTYVLTDNTAAGGPWNICDCIGVGS